MEESTNKFGVPYHAYRLRLSNGEMVEFDMAWEESWGDVNDLAFTDRRGREVDEAFVGFGNDVDGYYRILSVFDYEADCYITPKEFAERCASYTDCYSS